MQGRSALIRTVHSSDTHPDRCLCAGVPGEVTAYSSWVRRHSEVSWASFLLIHSLSPSADEGKIHNALPWHLILDH